MLTVGAIRFHPATGLMQWPEGQRTLTGWRRAVTDLLLSRAGRLVTADALMDAAWGDRPDGPGMMDLRVLIHVLRRAAVPVRTIRGVGYIVDDAAQQYRTFVFTDAQVAALRALAPEIMAAGEVRA